MAVYKVIQDVEAEDKLVGFLTLRSFIYAIIAGSLAYINFRMLIATQLGPTRWAVIFFLFFPMLLFGILCLPLGKEQPTEVWILSRLRFFIKPRLRVWNQLGAQELVTITVPKKIERQLTKNITQSEVQSRLKALANTLDSRGWAVKNVTVNVGAHPTYLDINNPDSDRLISASATQEPQVVDVQAEDDIMDERNNPTAQKFESLMQKADADRKQEIKNKLQSAIDEKPQENIDFSFLDQVPPSIDTAGNTTFVARKTVGPDSPVPKAKDSTTIAGNNPGNPEKAFLDKVHKTAEYVHEHAPGSVTPTTTKPLAGTVTDTTQTDKLKRLSEVAKDDKVSTLAQMAKREVDQVKQISDNEVEIDINH